MENNEIYNNIFNFLNQPFVIAIGVALVIGIFTLIIVRELSIGKKSVKEQDKKIANYGESEKAIKKEIIEKKNELIKAKDIFIEDSRQEFKKFYNNNEDFRKAVFSALESINNIGVKKALEEYKNGKAEETKDN